MRCCLLVPTSRLHFCRSAPKSAELWEGLAASYQALGRHASALKSYSRTLELAPARPYALMSCGALHYMAGAYQDAAQQYRAALQLLPQHPAALLGLAEVLLSSACRHMAMGAAGAATLELTEAAERATAAVSGVEAEPWAAADADAAASAAAAADGPQQPPQMLSSSNLVTAWKLLGDILLQKHLLQPMTAAAAATGAATATTHTDNAAAAVEASLQHLAARRQLLQRARRAYARALALNPAAGEVWGDLALCYSHEAKLLQELQPQQPAGQQGATAAAIAAARAAAVRTARGGLRLSPASSWLWGVLAGALAAVGDPAAAEFSYSRALALDPKAAALWVQLGRLYSRHGSGGWWLRLGHV
jgi:tetratricopeptide (TPR) repeat protein